jgi:hypothetical protein
VIAKLVMVIEQKNLVGDGDYFCYLGMRHLKL